ncbi:MAG TPA: ABC transporter permease [Holophaga sp.]|nr:ABC transporter permease [Holophaga sp.]HPS66902.1 ABC transporter permease [Holophaga sp.]
MINYIIKRIAHAAIVLAVVSVVIFCLTTYIGDPVNMMVSEKASAGTRELVRQQLGLNEPLPVQYWIFLKNVMNGQFGHSYTYKIPVIGLILERLPATLEMVAVSIVLAVVIAIPLGVFAGAFPKRGISRIIMASSLFGASLPTFFVGMMLILIFAVNLGWLPSSGRGPSSVVMGVRLSINDPAGIRYMILPALTLAFANLAMLIRLTRAGMMEVMRHDFIRFARAKGVSERDVMFKHALKNALIPVVTVFGMEIGSLIAFTTVTETIFAWPGLGKLLMDSIYASDRPVIVVYLLLTAVLFVVLNFIVDMLYTIIDPRIDLR